MSWPRDAELVYSFGREVGRTEGEIEGGKEEKLY